MASAMLFFVACGTDDPVQPAPDDSDDVGPEVIELFDGPAHDTVVEAGGVRFNMVYVPAGSFTMGATTSRGATGYDPDADAIEQPTHPVYLDGFLIADVEVSQFLFFAVMGWNPSQHTDIDMPVHNVSYTNALAFIDELSKVTRLRFRLPTEAEWEYAAKGGGRSDSNYYFSGSNVADSVAWSSHNSDGELHISGLLKPNALGLYDMSGNVMEWCSDWYGPYSSAAATNPQGPEQPSNPNLQKRAIRGGSYLQSPYYLRNTARDFRFGSSETKEIGLRLVLSVRK